MDADDAEGRLADLPDLALRDPDGELKPDEVAVPTLPLPPPRDRDELDVFLLALACTPTGQHQLIRDTIAGLGDRDAVADLLHEAMFDLPARDLGRHLTLLSFVGQLRHETSIEPLEQFVWLEDSQVYDFSHEERESEDDGSAGSTFEQGGVLQARAAEMLVWVTGGAYINGVRRILGSHPSGVVRVAAIDAHAFAHDDDPEVVEELRRFARDEDQRAVGLPRRFDGQDTDAFDAAMEQHQARYGSTAELPDRSRGGRSDESG